MTLKEQVLQSVSQHLGTVIAVDEENGRIAYADPFLEQRYHKKNEDYLAVDVFPWLEDCPQLTEYDSVVEWETIDVNAHKCYKVESYLFCDEKVYKVHRLTDITDYMKLNRDVTKYMSFFKKMAGFQTAILEKLSSTYYELLPMLSDFFKTDKMFFMLHRETHIEIIMYNKTMQRCINARIREEDQILQAFSYERDMYCEVSSLAPVWKEALMTAGITADKKVYSLCHGDVSEQKYALFFVETTKMDKESLKEESLISVIRLYIENIMMREKMIYDSEHDALTGLYNKGKYLSMFESEYQKMDSIGIFNFDVNNLKLMNDIYGHEAGDRLIIKGADSIRRLTGDTVHGYRMGGDEFLMIACNATKDEVLRLQKQWEEELARLNTPEDGIECVMAVGVAYGEKGYDFATLMQEADERMYEDKKRKKKTGEEIR